LRAILDEQGRKRVWLAHAVGVSQGTITNWTKGRTLPSYLLAMRVAKVLDTPVASIWPQNGSGSTNGKEGG